MTSWTLIYFFSFHLDICIPVRMDCKCKNNPDRFWADDQHYIRQEWPLTEGLKPGSHNVQSHPLIEPNKILLPPLHIKLGVMKNFVKAMERESSSFAFLQKFPRKSMEKLKAGIFDSPQKNSWRTQCLTKYWVKPNYLAVIEASSYKFPGKPPKRRKQSHWSVSAILEHECQSSCTFHSHT